MSALTVRAYGARSITSAKVALDTIINEVIKTDAGIALSKLAATTASRALVSDGSGFVSVSAVTATELGYVSGVTSSLQTQINNLALGVYRRKSVIALVDPTAAPPTEVTGDRYILGYDAGVVHADWDTCVKGQIATFGASAWTGETPAEGWRVYGDTANVDYLFIDDGSPAWQSMATASMYLAEGKIFVGDATNTAVGVTPTGDVTISTLGVTAIGATRVTNAMLAGSIADTNLSTISTANKVSGSAVQLAADASIADSTGLKGLKMFAEVLTLDGADITAQFKDGTKKPYSTIASLKVVGLGPLFLGVDYSVSTVANKIRITFLNDLATGGAQALVAADVIEIGYDYI